MPIAYKFITAPEFNYQTSKVILSIEDYFKIMKLAEDQLNSGTTNAGQSSDVPQGAKQQVYIEKLVIDNSKHAVSLGVGQQLINNQSQLNASFASALSKIAQISHILNSTEGQKLPKTPLQFLSASLGKFTSASLIFSTKALLPKTAVAPEFHAACDHKPNGATIPPDYVCIDWLAIHP